MSNEARILDTGVDALQFARFNQYLGINQFDLEDEYRFNKIVDIVRYLKDHPDPQYFINRALNSKMVDRVDHVWEYVQLNIRREELAKEKEEIENKATQLEAILNETNDDETYFKLEEIKNSRDRINGELESTESQIGFYEK